MVSTIAPLTDANASTQIVRRSLIVSNTSHSAVAAEAVSVERQSQNCTSLVNITDMTFPTIGAADAHTATVSATIHFQSGCSTSARMSLILADGSGSPNFMMHSSHAALSFKLFMGTDATGPQVWNDVPLAVGQLDSRNPELHLFGEVQSKGAIAPGNYSDNITATMRR